MLQLKILSPQYHQYEASLLMLKELQCAFFFLHARYVSAHKFPEFLSNQTAMDGSWHTQENAHPSAGHVT